MHRFVLVFAIVACTPRERPTALVGTPLGESTAPGPRAPVYMAPDAGILVAPVSPGMLAAPRGGGNAPAAPTAAPAPAPAPAAPAAPAQVGVASPPPQNP